MLAKLLPEATALLMVAWFILRNGSIQQRESDALMLVAMVDGATLMASATLIDLASRLKQAPPWWLAVPIIGAVPILYPDVFWALRTAWRNGMWVFLPLAWPILERIREVWTLPSASDVEKIRRRTLTFDRLYSAIVMGWLIFAGALAASFALDVELSSILHEHNLPWVMLAFYAIAAFNAWRVHRPAFVRRPRSLWPWIDKGDSAQLDPL